MRKSVVRLITIVGGLFFLGEFLIPAKLPDWMPDWVGGKNPLTEYRSIINDGIIVIAAMAFLLGPINLCRAHITTILKKNRGWIESIVFLMFLSISIFAGFSRAQEPSTDFELTVETIHRVLFLGILMAFGISSMALLAFYLVSAAHRAFRLTSFEAGVMMISATIILLGSAPVGIWITNAVPKDYGAFTLPAWSEWILKTPTTGVGRGVMIGAFAGAFASGLRYWLGLGTVKE